MMRQKAMIHSDSLEELERRAYRSTFSDGIYDIQFALFFIVFAWFAVIDALGISRFVGYALLVVPVLLPWLGKRYITIPRMGAVEFRQKRKSRNRITLVVAAGAAVLLAPVVIMTADSGAAELGWRLVAMAVAPIAAIAIYALDFPRLFLYLAFLMAAVLESEFLVRFVGTPANAVISFGIPGLIILCAGLYQLFRFIQRYPKAKAEAHYAG